MDVRIVYNISSGQQESVHNVFAVGASRMGAVVLWDCVQLNQCPVTSRCFTFIALYEYVSIMEPVTAQSHAGSSATMTCGRGLQAGGQPPSLSRKATLKKKNDKKNDRSPVHALVCTSCLSTDILLNMQR